MARTNLEARFECKSCDQMSLAVRKEHKRTRKNDANNGPTDGQNNQTNKSGFSCSPTKKPILTIRKRREH